MIIDCLSKAIFLFVIYNIVSLILFGVPKSLSATYYLYKEQNESLKVLFPAMITMLCIFLIPCWLEISEGSNFQFLSFLSAGSLLFVGASPAVDSNKLEGYIHKTSAYLCAAFAILWIILVTPYWYILLIVTAIILVIAFLTKTLKSSNVYWLEMIVFISTFISITAYYVSHK